MRSNMNWNELNAIHDKIAETNLSGWFLEIDVEDVPDFCVNYRQLTGRLPKMFTQRKERLVRIPERLLKRILPRRHRS